jgi:DNA-binding CsgD family transcriptional regulator
MHQPCPPCRAVEASRAALACFADPLLIMDEARGIVFANPRAEEEFAGGEVLRLRHGKLAGATGSAEAALQRCEALNGHAFEALVEGLDGESRFLAAAPLQPGGPPSGGRRMLLILRRPGDEALNAVATAARLFGLTAAQRQVLGLLVQGLRPRQIGRRLGVSLTTVRTHLGDLFGKTGTSRQAELVARTLALASPLHRATVP